MSENKVEKISFCENKEIKYISFFFFIAMCAFPQLYVFILNFYHV